jgi:hypothetical protein
VHFLPTAQAARSKRRRPPSQAKPSSRPAPDRAIPANGSPKPIPRRYRIHRHAGLQAFCNDLRLDLVRPPLLAIGPYLNPGVPEKLHRSRHRETPTPISVRCGVAGRAKTGKVQPRKRLQIFPGSRHRWREDESACDLHNDRYRGQ